MNDLVRTAKALADSTRVRIISALLERELCVCELCDSLEVTQSTLSTHLQVIREAGLVSARKDGKWMYYEIQPGARVVIEGLFKSFGLSLKADAALRRDAQRLGRRLSLRDNGACCVGFAAPGRATRKRRC
jgi:ArsR family transcriptional regulator